MLIPLHPVLIPGLLLLAALFAAAETSLFSLTRPQLEALRMRAPFAHRLVKILLSQPEKLLSSIIIGNELLNITIGALVGATVEYALGEMGVYASVLIAVVISSALLLVFSEVLPKVIAFRIPVLVAMFLAYPMYAAFRLFSPLGRVFLFASDRILRATGTQTLAPEALSEMDLITLAEAGAESGTLDLREHQMILNVFRFSDNTAASVMTPWKEVLTLRESAQVADALNVLKKRPLSRIPVLGTDGRVAGILYSKEVWKSLLAPAELKRPLRDLLDPAFVVSANKKISSLFREFRSRKVHFAVVLDETGRQIGVVTLQDVLNALFQTRARREGAT